MNTVSIIGILKEKIDDNFRYFLYELPFDEENNEAETKIVVKNWTNLPNSRLLVLPNNTRVAIEGHLDAHKKYGTIIVVSQVQALR